MKKYTKEQLMKMLKNMYLARNFDLKVAQLVQRGKVPGMTHFSVGEEAAGMGAVLALKPDDLMTSNHRGHAQVIAKGININGMMAEIMGKYNGVCKGKGGSMHMADLDNGNLGANGIVGGGHGISIGAALTQKMKKTGKVVLCIFGDGATNEGSFHEALNLASIWKLPVIFYSINNGYGISASISDMINIDHIYKRAKAYGIPGHFIPDGNNILEVYEKFQEVIEYVRNGNGPVLVESITYRWFGHSSSDPGKYRSREEVNSWKKKDPIKKLKKHMLENNFATEEEIENLENNVKNIIENAVKYAEESPIPPLESAFEDVYTD